MDGSNPEPDPAWWRVPLSIYTFFFLEKYFLAEDVPGKQQLSLI